MAYFYKQQNSSYQQEEFTIQECKNASIVMCLMGAGGAVFFLLLLLNSSVNWITILLFIIFLLLAIGGYGNIRIANSIIENSYTPNSDEELIEILKENIDD